MRSVAMNAARRVAQTGAFRPAALPVRASLTAPLLAMRPMSSTPALAARPALAVALRPSAALSAAPARAMASAAKHDDHHDDHHGHHDHRVFSPPYNPWGAPFAILLFIVVGGLATSVIALVVGMWNTWGLGRYFGGK